MALTPKLEIRQSQSLVMTPQLQQAIKLLQLSNLELSSYVEEQVERNPLLDLEESVSNDNNAPASRDNSNSERSEHSDASGEELTTDRTLSGDSSSQTAQDSLDADYESVYTEDTKADAQNNPGDQDLGHNASNWSNVGAASSGFSDDSFDLEATLSNEVSLRDHLREQLTMTKMSDIERAIGAYLIESIDEAGYLKEGIESIAERLGTSPESIEQTLLELQNFDPAGVFARDLAECLALQLRDRNRLDPAMQAMLDNLVLLADRKLSELSAICGVDDEDLVEMQKEIRELDPKPGLSFAHEIVEAIVPDVYVRQKADGTWKIELNSDTLPKVLLNQTYYAEVSKVAKNRDDKGYLTECYNNASWLVKSLDQRAKTILKVATEIVRQQDAFLVHGIHCLKPLNLKTVAEAISMHESTISRVTSNKYIATPRGLFEMKYFFTSAISSSNGGSAHSAEAVRHRIKELIDKEEPTSILSDDRIVEILNESGIEIARRTVAKYREALKIPSSIQRRRMKKHAV